MNETEHAILSAIVAAWAGWVAYTCFKRAIAPPKDNPKWWHLESYVVNRNPLTRILNVLAGILVLAVGLSVALSK